MPSEIINRNGKEIMLLGTAHVSQGSIDEVKTAIASYRPDTLAVELCKGRFDVMKNPTAWQETDIVKVIKDKKASLLFVNLLMAAFQRRIGSKIGIKPGEEMRVAIAAAEEAGIPISLIDRGVQVTLQRTWNKLSFIEKFSLLFQSLVSILGAEDLTEDDIERLKEKDILSAALEEVAKKAPVVKEVILDERDSYMAGKLDLIEGKRILAVIGAGHMEGIKARFGTKIDIAALEEVPPKKKSYAGWIFAGLILVLILMGVLKGGVGQGIQMFGIWAGSTMFFSAVGALIAFGHPLTIIVAAAVSPLTAIHPALASGWFAGLTEAWLKKPKVSDFQSIHSDIETIRGFWRNPITRILLVVILTNMGTMFGSLIAMPILTKIILKS